MRFFPFFFISSYFTKLYIVHVHIYFSKFTRSGFCFISHCIILLRFRYSHKGLLCWQTHKIFQNLPIVFLHIKTPWLHLCPSLLTYLHFCNIFYLSLCPPSLCPLPDHPEFGPIFFIVLIPSSVIIPLSRAQPPPPLGPLFSGGCWCSLSVQRPTVLQLKARYELSGMCQSARHDAF